MAWLVYDLVRDDENCRFHLMHKKTVYTKFQDSLSTMSEPARGDLNVFVDHLQHKLDKRLDRDDRNPSDAPTLDQMT